MTLQEVAGAVAVALAVVAVTLAISYVIVLALRIVGRLRFPRLQCLMRGHAWITVTFGYFHEPEPYHRHRICGRCDRREELGTT